MNRSNQNSSLAAKRPLIALFLAVVSPLAVASGPSSQERKHLAVVDFAVSGDVGIPDAGRSVAALLLPKFETKYQLVERAQLATILAEHDLAMADIVHNPSLVHTKKLQGVHYLVIGSVVKLGNLAISARLVDVSTGQIAQTAEVSANDALGLQSALDQLASILAMTPEEKRAYFDERGYPSLVKEARRLAADKKYDPALRLYRRILSIRFNESLQQELIELERKRQSNTVFVEIQGSGCASKVELTYTTYERPMLLVRSEDGSIRALLVQDGFLVDFDDRQAFEEYVAEYEFLLVMAFSGDGLSLRNRKTDSVFDSLVMGSRMGVWGFKEHGGADVELYYLEESPRRIRLTAKLPVSRFSPEYSVPDFNKLQECDAGEIRFQIRGPFVVYKEETP